MRPGFGAQAPPQARPVASSVLLLSRLPVPSHSRTEMTDSSHCCSVMVSAGPGAPVWDRRLEPEIGACAAGAGMLSGAGRVDVPLYGTAVPWGVGRPVLGECVGFWGAEHGSDRAVNPPEAMLWVTYPETRLLGLYTRLILCGVENNWLLARLRVRGASRGFEKVFQCVTLKHLLN